MRTPSLTRLNELLFLDTREGKLFWRVTRGRVRAGERADLFHPISGYYRVSVDGVRYRAHLIVWYMLKGEWCPRGVDHADRDRGNNRPDNLRKATESQQRQNKGKQSNNTSGRVGVYWHKASQKWEAMVVRNGVKLYRERFDSLDEADAAVRRERAKIFGEFAPIERTVSNDGK